ncbi:MAG: hypothetical protein AAFP03_15380, partial [Cyanobacteria bacterium J06598_3]
LDGKLDRPLDLSQSLDRALELDILRAPARDFEIISTYLCTHLVIWKILIRSYDKDLRSNRLPFIERVRFQKSRLIKREYLYNFKDVLNIYLFFLTVRLRQLGKLPAWESIQIVREEC